MNFADNYYKKSLIQRLAGPQQELLTVYCRGTNMPLVECSTESFNDRVFVFENEELLKEFSKPYMDKKLALQGIRFEAKNKMRFFSTLLCMNVDEIVFVDHAGRHPVTLGDFVKKQDFSKLPKEKRPIENPQLLLSGLYFVQEACRAVPQEQKTGLKELEEEFAANLVKSTYILPVDFTPPGQESAKGTAGTGEENAADQAVPTPAPDASGKVQLQFRIPLIKTPKGEMVQPLFTDHLEFARYNPENKLKALAVPFANLEKMLAKEVHSYMLNPNGFHIQLTREMLNGLARRFPRGNKTDE